MRRGIFPGTAKVLQAAADKVLEPVDDGLRQQLVRLKEAAAMNITHGYSQLSQVATLDATETASMQKSATGSVTASNFNSHDKASLSGTAGALQTASAMDDVRTDVVAKLRAAIESNSYNVPASVVADRILSSMFGR